MDRGATKRTQLFDMMDSNKTVNPVKLPGAMPMICLEISQLGIRHPMLNHFQHGVRISNFRFCQLLAVF